MIDLDQLLSLSDWFRPFGQRQKGAERKEEKEVIEKSIGDEWTGKYVPILCSPAILISIMALTQGR